jgi:tRNA pseudouridine38-40 synthase
MINIKIIIEYEGARYHGWQRQKNVLSIQQVLEEKISQITKEKIELIASGRTDAGVNSLGQVANFKTNSSIPWRKIPLILNHLLPSDIRIKRVEKVEDDFHARHSAIGKIYNYYVFNCNKDNCYPSFYLRNYVYPVYGKINLEEMKKATIYLLGKHDFSSFACSGSSIRGKIRTIKKISINKRGNIICFSFEANAFLYKMVRTIVGTLLEVSQDKINSWEVKDILEAKDRRKAGKVVPAKGLFLMQVNY